MVTVTMTETNFITRIISRDVKMNGIGPVITRFPPEPNGPLHVGHAKSLILNASISAIHHGTWTLRLDDTNPQNERCKYVSSIIRTLKWFGFRSFPNHFASDYYPELYRLAFMLLESGQAYVDQHGFREFKLSKGTFHSKGKVSVDRNKAVNDSVKLLRQMKFGRFGPKQKVLRAKISPSSPHLNLRDPVLYRTSFARHYRTGYSWHLHPTYDYAHAVSDYLEGTTHSLCTLEFEHSRDLYNWIISKAVGLKLTTRTTAPKQIEFARLNVEGVVTSKRTMLRLLRTGSIKRFDDLRLGTIMSVRRSGLLSEVLKAFIKALGISKSCSLIRREVLDGVTEKLLEFGVPQRMAIFRPLKLVIENEGGAILPAASLASNPYQFFSGRRRVILTKELLIEPISAWRNQTKHRLYSGSIIKLRNGPVLKFLRLVRSGRGLLVRAMSFPFTSKARTDNNSNEKRWVSASFNNNIVANLCTARLASNKINTLRCERYGNEWLSNGQPSKLEGVGCFVGDYTTETGSLAKFNLTVRS